MIVKSHSNRALTEVNDKKEKDIFDLKHAKYF